MRLLRFVFRASIWVATAMMLLLCVVFARLFFAPINLDFARETVVEQASGFLPGWQFSYGAAEVGWDWSAVRPWVVLEDIQLIDRRNRLNATISEARVVISMGSVLRGASLSTVDISNAHVNITDIGGFSDDTDETVFDDLFASGVPTPAIFKPLSEAFSRFSTRLLDNAPNLEGMNFSNVTVDVARGEALSVFSVAAPSFRLERLKNNLLLAAQLEANLANVPTRIRLGGTAEPSSGQIALSLAFSEVKLATLAPAFDLPEVLGFLQFPFGLDLQLEMTSAQGLRSAAFDISISEGELRHAELFPEGAAVDYGLISAAYDVDKHLLTFGNIEISLGGNLVDGDGSAYWLEGYQNPGLRFNFALDQASLADIKKYWPIKLDESGKPRGAREWIAQNMLAGEAQNVRFAVNIEPDGSSPFLNDSMFEILFDFENIDSRYLKTMLPLTNASGHGVFTRTEFDMFLDSGTTGGLPVGGSKIHMFDIHKRGEAKGEIDIALSGDIGEVLALVMPPPVLIKDRIKIALSRLGGFADVTAKISLPLVKAVPKEQVLYDVSANIQNARLDNLLGGEGLSNAAVSLALNKDVLTAKSSGNLNGVPLDIYWRENFAAGRADPKADTSSMVLSGRLDENDLLKLGVDVAEYVDGKMLSEATFLGRNLKFRVGYFSADAADARLSVPQLAWEKGTSIPANINGTVFFDENKLRIEPLTVKGEDIDVEANIKLHPGDNSRFDAQFTVNALGRNKLLATLVGMPQGGISAVVAAERFDLAPLLAREEEPVAQAGTDAAISARSNFKLAVEAQELLLLNGARLSDVKLDTTFESGEPVELELTGRGELGLSRIDILSSTDVMRPVSMQSADAGTILRGLGFFAHMEGGALTLQGETGGWGKNLQFFGALDVRDSVLVGKEKLGSDVELGVIGGLDDYLKDGTLTLDVVDMPFGYQNGLLDFSSAKANGPSMGMTMEGQIDTRAGKINVNGVVVPAYGLNSLLGKIPLVGNIFSGGDGKGLFGMAYRVKGTTAAPEVNVNPLSGLAPGFLRLLFEGKKGDVDDVDLEPDPVAPSAPTEAPSPAVPTDKPDGQPPQTGR